METGPTWLTSKTLWPTWNLTGDVPSQPTNVTSALTIEDAEVSEEETTQKTSTVDHGLHQISHLKL